MKLYLEEIEFSIRFRFQVYLNWWDVTLSAANVNTSLSLFAFLCSCWHVDEPNSPCLSLSLSFSFNVYAVSVCMRCSLFLRSTKECSSVQSPIHSYWIVQSHNAGEFNIQRMLSYILKLVIHISCTGYPIWMHNWFKIKAGIFEFSSAFCVFCSFLLKSAFRRVKSSKPCQ